MTDKTYEDGLRDGQIASHNEILKDHKGRLDNHARRLALVERIIYALGGVYLLISLWPALQSFLGVGP